MQKVSKIWVEDEVTVKGINWILKFKIEKALYHPPFQRLKISKERGGGKDWLAENCLAETTHLES